MINSTIIQKSLILNRIKSQLNNRNEMSYIAKKLKLTNSLFAMNSKYSTILNKSTNKNEKLMFNYVLNFRPSIDINKSDDILHNKNDFDQYYNKKETVLNYGNYFNFNELLLGKFFNFYTNNEFEESIKILEKICEKLYMRQLYYEYQQIQILVDKNINFCFYHTELYSMMYILEKIGFSRINIFQYNASEKNGKDISLELKKQINILENEYVNIEKIDKFQYFPITCGIIPKNFNTYSKRKTNAITYFENKEILKNVYKNIVKDFLNVKENSDLYDYLRKKHQIFNSKTIKMNSVSDKTKIFELSEKDLNADEISKHPYIEKNYYLFYFDSNSEYYFYSQSQTYKSKSNSNNSNSNKLSNLKFFDNPELRNNQENSKETSNSKIKNQVKIFNKNTEVHELIQFRKFVLFNEKSDVNKTLKISYFISKLSGELSNINNLMDKKQKENENDSDSMISSFKNFIEENLNNPDNKMKNENKDKNKFHTKENFKDMKNKENIEILINSPDIYSSITIKYMLDKVFPEINSHIIIKDMKNYKDLLENLAESLNNVNKKNVNDNEDL